MEDHTEIGVIKPPAYLKPTEAEHWRVLLAEFVHLLGLLLIHSRHAQSVKATSVLFDQMMRHLSILDKMPGHEGALMLSCSELESSGPAKGVNYRILFGNLILQRAPHEKDATPITGKHANYLNNALDQTFGYLLGYGIHSLYLQLPGESDDKIDQLRLALNIISRFQDAVENKGAVTFHYGDRALAVPLIYNPRQRPDFNLTLLAGMNGLSEANAKELIKQAQAFHDLALAANVDNPQQYKVVKESYDQIFKVRSLRSQIVKPLLEVNNIPWISEQEAVKACDASDADPELSTDTAADPCDAVRARSIDVPDRDNFPKTDATRQYLTGYLKSEDARFEKDLDAILIDDYQPLNTQGLAERLVAGSRLLYGIEKKSQDPAVVDHLLNFLQVRLLQVSDQVLADIEVLRQGLRFLTQGRAMVVGLVHSRLVDMVTLVKDQVTTRRKIAVIQKIAFDFNHQYTGLVVDGFNISTEHAHHLLDLFKCCFGTGGRFNREAFEARIDGMAQQANAFFEVNWCFLKETPHFKDRLAFLNAIQLLMARLKDPKRALRFLMDDLCQNTEQVDYTDRNAFVLGNVLLQAENTTLHVDLECTSETILGSAHQVDNEVHQYALWRINTDQIRVVNKIKTIHHALEDALASAAEGETGAVDFLLALEREALIFMALVNGPTARRIVCSLLERYADPQTALYASASRSGKLSHILAQLEIVVRCMAWVGYSEHIPLVQSLADNIDHFLDLEPHPVHAVRVKKIMEWVPATINKIMSNTQ